MFADIGPGTRTKSKASHVALTGLHGWTMQPAPATHFGIIIDTRLGAIVRIFNPTYEFEFACHHVGKNEEMYKLKKTAHNIPLDGHGMTIADVYRILQTYGAIL